MDQLIFNKLEESTEFETFKLQSKQLSNSVLYIIFKTEKINKSIMVGLQTIIAKYKKDYDAIVLDFSNIDTFSPTVLSDNKAMFKNLETDSRVQRVSIIMTGDIKIKASRAIIKAFNPKSVTKIFNREEPAIHFSFGIDQNTKK